MTVSIAMNSQQDIYLDDSGNLALVRDVDAVAQACTQAASSVLGEMTFAVEKGIPYFDTVFTSRRNIPQFEFYLRKEISAVPDVVDVKSLEVTQEDDVLKYVATVRTIYGEVSING